MYTTGKFSSHLDAQIGFSFDDLEHMSIRQQRQIIKQRAKQMIKNQRLKFRFQNPGLTSSAISSDASLPMKSPHDHSAERRSFVNQKKASVDTKLQEGTDVESKQYVYAGPSPMFKKSKDALTIGSLENTDQSTYQHRQSSQYNTSLTPSVPTKMQKHSIERIDQVRRSGRVRAGRTYMGMEH